MENNKDELTQHENHRKQLWADAWTSCATASNCTKHSVCTTWADEALKAFDERFVKPNIESTVN